MTSFDRGTTSLGYNKEHSRQADNVVSIIKYKLWSDLQQNTVLFESDKLPLNKTVPSSAVDLDEFPISKLEPYPVEKPQQSSHMSKYHNQKFRTLVTA